MGAKEEKDKALERVNDVLKSGFWGKSKLDELIDSLHSVEAFAKKMESMRDDIANQMADAIVRKVKSDLEKEEWLQEVAIKLKAQIR